MNILIIEDNIVLVEQIYQTFRSHITINTFFHISSYEGFLKASLDIHHYDIVLLDVMLPGADTKEKNGLCIAQHIRMHNRSIPIIIMTGVSDLSFLEKAFESGVNDYIIKPFRPKELQIRMYKWYQSYLSSLHFFHNNVLHYYELHYSVGGNQFYLEDVPLFITKKSKYLFLLLFIKAEEITTYDFLITKLRNTDSYDNEKEKNLRVNILRLKKSLKRYGIDNRIITIRSEGYILKKYFDKKFL